MRPGGPSTRHPSLRSYPQPQLRAVLPERPHHPSPITCTYSGQSRGSTGGVGTSARRCVGRPRLARPLRSPPAAEHRVGGDRFRPRPRSLPAPARRAGRRRPARPRGSARCAAAGRVPGARRPRRSVRRRRARPSRRSPRAAPISTQEWATITARSPIEVPAPTRIVPATASMRRPGRGARRRRARRARPAPRARARPRSPAPNAPRAAARANAPASRRLHQFKHPVQ